MNRGLAALIVFLLAAAGAHVQAAEPPAEFAGFPWTATFDDVKTAMDKTPDVHLRESRPDYLVYNGGTLADQPLYVISFDFDPRKLRRGAAVFKPAADREKQYRDLRSVLTAKYGTPTSDKRVGQTAAGDLAFFRQRSSARMRSPSLVNALANDPTAGTLDQGHLYSRGNPDCGKTFRLGPVKLGRFSSPAPAGRPQ